MGVMAPAWNGRPKALDSAASVIVMEAACAENSGGEALLGVSGQILGNLLVDLEEIAEWRRWWERVSASDDRVLFMMTKLGPRASWRYLAGYVKRKWGGARAHQGGLRPPMTLHDLEAHLNLLRRIETEGHGVAGKLARARARIARAEVWKEVYVAATIMRQALSGGVDGGVDDIQEMDLLGPPLDASEEVCSALVELAGRRRERVRAEAELCRPPSLGQQRWLPRVGAAAGGIFAVGMGYAYSARFVTMADAARMLLLDNMSELARYLVDDLLWPRFRERPNVVSKAEFEMEQRCLWNLLEEWQKESRMAENAEAMPLKIETKAAEEKVMEEVMREFESKAGSPWESALSLKGSSLTTLLLIQMQKLKVDSTGAMLSLDQVLKANELTTMITASIPAFIGCWLLAGAARWAIFQLPYSLGLVGDRNAEREEGFVSLRASLRVALSRIERGLLRAIPAESLPESSPVSARIQADFGPMQDIEVGRLLMHVLAMCSLSGCIRGGGTDHLGAEAEKGPTWSAYRSLWGTFIGRGRELSLGPEEAASFREDLYDLVHPSLSLEKKLRTCNRMARTYACFSNER